MKTRTDKYDVPCCCDKVKPLIRWRLWFYKIECPRCGLKTDGWLFKFNKALKEWKKEIEMKRYFMSTDFHILAAHAAAELLREKLDKKG